MDVWLAAIEVSLLVYVYGCMDGWMDGCMAGGDSKASLEVSSLVYVYGCMD